MKKLCFATNNEHKLTEARYILRSNIDVASLKDINCNDELQETQPTIEGNSLQKAKFVFDTFNVSCFADDTGLEVEALNGNPGVQSKRFFKTKGEARNQELLKLIGNDPNRNAKFVAAIAVYNPETKEVKVFSGEVAGEIVKPTGEAHIDLGYDSIFKINALGKTFGEATLAEKNQLSHRAIAVKKSFAYLSTLLT